MKRMLVLLLAIALVMSAVPTFAETKNDYAGVAAFSEALFEAVRKGGDQDIAISPISAYYALAMAAKGADGETAEAFEQVLGMTTDEMMAFCKDFAEHLMESAGNTKLVLANALWVDDSVAIKDTYQQALNEYFAAEYHAAKFSDPSTVADVNQWVSKKTQGLIPEMLSEINPEIAMMLINTLYMNAKWARPFEEHRTHQDTFTLADGKTIQTDFMHSDTTTWQYVWDEAVEGVLLPYDDERLAFLAVISREGNQEALQLTGDSIATWVASAAPKTNMLITLPPMDRTYGTSLSDMLQAMGLADAFMPSADFSNMADREDTPLYIGDVLQKVVIRVDEEGTEAAAATSVMMAMGAALVQEEPYELRFDRPFLYAVIDLETSLPLFIGTMDTPD